MSTAEFVDGDDACRLVDVLSYSSLPGHERLVCWPVSICERRIGESLADVSVDDHPGQVGLTVFVEIEAHADDEGPVAPILARYAREGVQVQLIIASDGPQARYFTVRVPFTPEDLQASARGMACHKTQFTSEVVQRVHGAAARAWNGAIPLIPAFSTPALTDLFR